MAIFFVPQVAEQINLNCHLVSPTYTAGASFPPYKGLISIILAWFIAPVLSGATAALFFFIARTAVLRRKNAYAVSFWILPLAVLATVWGEMWPAAHSQPALHCVTSSSRLACFPALLCCRQCAQCAQLKLSAHRAHN